MWWRCKNQRCRLHSDVWSFHTVGWRVQPTHQTSTREALFTEPVWQLLVHDRLGQGIFFEMFGEHKIFACLKLIEIIILWVYYTIPFGFSLFWHVLVITFQLFTTCLAQDSLMRVQYPKYTYGPYRWLNPIENGVYILVEVSNSIPKLGWEEPM